MTMQDTIGGGTTTGSPVAQDSPTPNIVESATTGTTTTTPVTPTPTTAPSTSGGVDWESDSNPYRYAAQMQQQQLMQMQQAQEQSRLQQEARQAIQRGIPPNQVQAALELRNQQMQIAQQRQQLDAQSRPIAASVLSEKIKAAYGITIAPNELLMSSSGNQINTPEALLARADALVSERRKDSMAKRQKSGADKVGKADGGSVSGIDPATLRGMSPTQILKMGISRMQE